MATPGIGVAIHYVPDYDEHEAVVLLRASCGIEAAGVILDWFDHLPKGTKACDHCFLTLPARRTVN